MNERKEFLGFSRSMLFQCVLLYIGIWGGLLANNYVFLVVAGCTVLVSLFSKIDTTYYHLFFLLPYSVIFKLSPSSTSLFAYLMIVTGVVLLLRKRSIHAMPMVLVILFIAYAIIGMGGNYTTVAKMVSGIILLYVFVTSVAPENFKNHIMSFALGVLGSSIIGTMKDTWGRLTIYFDDIDYVYVNGVRSLRFSGLNYDPNYYSIGVIIVIFLCLRLFFKKEGNRMLLGSMIASLVVFGFISYSKMFLLSILLLSVVFMFYRMKSPKQLLTTLVSTVFIVGLFYWWAENSGYLSTILERLSGDDISTGRFEIWERYLEYIWNSPMTLLFGDGLGSPYYLSHGPHNAYIELVFFLGIIGGTILVLTIANIIGCTKYVERRTFIDRALVLLFFVMIATLGIVTVNDLMFYCMLLWISMNIRKETAI